MASTSHINEAGATEWRENGELHREDGPAYEWPDGSYQWNFRGKLHRTDGSAIFYTTSGYQGWWIDGKELTETEFMNMKKQKLLEAAQDILNHGTTSATKTLPRMKINPPKR